jgi:hypothetical protein
MAFSKYILSSKNLQGRIIVTYENGVLYSIILDIKSPLTTVQFTRLFTATPYNETEINEFQKLGLQINKDATNEKIASFCSAYKTYLKGIKYKVSAADSGKIKTVDVTDQLLEVYFTSDNFLFKGKYSISNYVKYFNELLQEASGLNKKPKFPAEWSKEFESKLQPAQMSEYWQYLRSLGFEPVKRNGQTIKWSKPGTY